MARDTRGTYIPHIRRVISPNFRGGQMWGWVQIGAVLAGRLGGDSPIYTMRGPQPRILNHRDSQT